MKLLPKIPKAIVLAIEEGSGTFTALLPTTWGIGHWALVIPPHAQKLHPLVGRVFHLVPGMSE
jgi:hypothetical protein